MAIFQPCLTSLHKNCQLPLSGGFTKNRDSLCSVDFAPTDKLASVNGRAKRPIVGDNHLRVVDLYVVVNGAGWDRNLRRSAEAVQQTLVYC